MAGEKVTLRVPENCEEEGCFLGWLSVYILLTMSVYH